VIRVERLGGFLPGERHADVIDDDQVATAHPADGPGNRPVGPGLADRGGQRFEVNQAIRMPFSIAACAMPRRNVTFRCLAARRQRDSRPG